MRWRASSDNGHDRKARMSLRDYLVYEEPGITLYCGVVQ
jgi:hypothetical protein